MKCFSEEIIFIAKTTFSDEYYYFVNGSTFSDEILFVTKTFSDEI